MHFPRVLYCLLNIILFFIFFTSPTYGNLIFKNTRSQPIDLLSRTELAAIRYEGSADPLLYHRSLFGDTWIFVNESWVLSLVPLWILLLIVFPRRVNHDACKILIYEYSGKAAQTTYRKFNKRKLFQEDQVCNIYIYININNLFLP